MQSSKDVSSYLNCLLKNTFHQLITLSINRTVSSNLSRHISVYRNIRRRFWKTTLAVASPTGESSTWLSQNWARARHVRPTVLATHSVNTINLAQWVTCNYPRKLKKKYKKEIRRELLTDRYKYFWVTF